MPISPRNWLLPLLVASLVAAPLLSAAEESLSGPALIAKLAPTHPRLLIDANGFDDLRRRIAEDETLADWDRHLVRQADAALQAPLPKHVLPDGKRLLSTSRRVLEHTYTLALVYRLHGGDAYRQRLWKELETVAAFPDFNPAHFLDTAEMTHALAIAYDWLYDDWTPAQRATIRTAIVSMGLRPGLEFYRKQDWWVRCTHNWNQVCNGGLTMGALAIGDEEPALCGEILAGAIQSVPRAMASYAPDGAWGEGPGYWGYATTYNVVMIAALQSALGSDFGLADAPGFERTGLFPLYMTGPTGRNFNFSDSSDRLGRLDPIYWLAERFDLPAATWFATTAAEPSPGGMIWRRRPGVDPDTAGLSRDAYWRGVEVVSMRSSWTDPRATFVALQAGSNRINHNHLDLGSFVLDALGQRWFLDLGGDNYNLPGYFGRQRYQYYRMRAEAHNTLVLNPGEGPDQNTAAEARIARFESTPERAFAIADLTSAYSKQAQRVERGIALLARRDVLVQDEIEADAPADLWWFAHTPAAVQLSADGRLATLTEKGVRLQAHLLSPAGAKFQVQPAAPLPSSPNPAGQRDNRGISRLTIHLPGTTAARLAVLFVPDGEDTAPTVELKPLAAW